MGEVPGESDVFRCISVYSDDFSWSRSSDSGNYCNFCDKNCLSAWNGYELFDLVDCDWLLGFFAYQVFFLWVHYPPGAILARSESVIFDLIYLDLDYIFS